MSDPQKLVLRTFHQYLMQPEEMLCFWGNTLDRHRTALEELVDAGMLTREKHPGGFSLTDSGFAVMRSNYSMEMAAK